MDHFSLRITTFECSNLHEIITSVKDPERITTLCTVGEMQSPKTYAQADVIILPYTWKEVYLSEILTYKAHYTQLIFMIQPDELSQLDPQQLVLAYDHWVFHPTLIPHHVKTLKLQMRTQFDLELTTKQLDTLIDSVPDLIWYKDARGSHIKVNQSFCNTVKKTKEQIRYRGHCYIWDLEPEEYEQGEYVCMETEDVVLEEQKTFLFDEKVKISDEMRQLKTYKSAIVGRNGESLGTVGIARDVTEIWNTHEEFRTLISRLPFPMMILNENYEFVSGNAQFESLFTHSEKHHENFEITTFSQHFFKKDIALRDKTNTSLEASMTHQGDVIHFIIEKSGIHDVFGELSGHFYIFRDVTEIKKYEKHLHLAAETDELTQMNNRKKLRSFYDAYADKITTKGATFTLGLLDIDYFKQYNDHYGHLAGDDVLIALSEILKRKTEGFKIFTARFGGEEFLFMALNQSHEAVINYIETTLLSLKSKEITHDFSEVAEVVTASIGAVTFTNIPKNTSLSVLIHESDQVLYQAKTQGRNRYILKNLDFMENNV